MRIGLLICACLLSSCNLSNEQLSLPVTEDMELDSESSDVRIDVVPESPGVASGFSPEDGSVNIPTETKITFSIDKRIDVETITAESFLLEDELGESVQAEYFVDEEGTRVTLVPSLPLHLFSQYTANITSQIKDLNGNALSPHSWSFRVRDGIWRDPEFIGTLEGYSDFPKIAAGSKGNAAVVWRYRVVSDTITRIQSNQFKHGLGWMEPLRISDGNESADWPTVHFDDYNNRIIAAWRQRKADGVEPVPYTLRATSHKTMWGIPEILDEGGSVSSSYIAIANDSQGNTTLLWSKSGETGYEIMSQTIRSDDWGKAKKIKSPYRYGVAYFLGIAASGDGVAGWKEDGGVTIAKHIHDEGWGIATQLVEDVDKISFDMNQSGEGILVWGTYSRTNGAKLWGRFYKDKEFAESFEIAVLPESRIFDNLEVQVNDNNEIFIVFSEDRKIYSTHFIENKWSEVEELDSSGDATSPKVRIDRNGNAFVSWLISNTLYVSRFKQDSGWGDPVTFDTVRDADFQISSLGEAIFVWSHSEGGNRVIRSVIFN